MKKYDVILQLKKLLATFNDINKMINNNTQNCIKFDKLFPTNKRKEFVQLGNMLTECSNRIWTNFNHLLNENFAKELISETFAIYSIVDNDWLDKLYQLYLEEGDKNENRK